MHVVPGGRSTELEVSNGAAEGQGLVNQMEELRLSCLYHLPGAMVTVRGMDWRLDRRPRAHGGGWTGPWPERAGLTRVMGQGRGAGGREAGGRGNSHGNDRR